MRAPTVFSSCLLWALTILPGCATADPSPAQTRIEESDAPAGSFLAGRFALDQGDFDAAATDLLRAQSADPNDKDLLLQTFIACVSVGRPEALALAARLPANYAAQLILADAAAKAGDWRGAIDKIQSVQRNGLTQLLQPLMLAWAFQGAGETDHALSILRPFLTNERQRGLFALHSAMIAEIGGQTQEASMLYQIAGANLMPQTVHGMTAMASWAARSGRQADAKRGLERLMEIDPETEIVMPDVLRMMDRRPIVHPMDGMSEVYEVFSAVLLAQQSTDVSMILSRLAIDSRPDSATALLRAADIQSGQKHYEAALDLLGQAAKSKDPFAGVARLRRISVLNRLGRTDLAIREAEQLGHDYPNSRLPDAALGDLLSSKKQYAEAIAAYDRAMARIGQPSQIDWPLWYSRGIAYERAGQWVRAEADFNKALQLSPDEPSVLNYLGYSWTEMGRNLDRARDMLQRASARRPNDGAITDSLGWVLYRQGKTAEAAKMLERAVSLEPVDPTITGHLGDVYWAMGRRIEAHFEWQRALTLNPSRDDTAKLLETIKSHPLNDMASGR